jgi:class 3 adenylate cyclase
MAQSEAPHTRGFLFADLRGYTQFVEKHGDKAASELLSAYRALVRAAVAKFSGAEIRTEGDGFYVVFPSASSAIRCGLAILEEAAQSTAAGGGPLPVGIGIHAGETDDSAEGFVGSAVNIAARVCALAAPGELLVTETVRGLVRTSMPLVMEPRGRRHLKGIREPIALFAVRPAGAAARSRAHRLRSLAARSFERRPVVVGFAALAGVAAVATVVLAVGLLANTNANPGARRLAATGSAGPTASASGAGTFPNADERALLARIDPAIAPLCRRAAASDYPWSLGQNYMMTKGGPVPIPGTQYTERLPVQVGLRCTPYQPAPDFVFVWRVDPRIKGGDSGSVVDEFFYIKAGTTPVGDCATDDRAHMDWSFGPFSGHLLCLATPARASIDWAYDGQDDLLLSAERDDGDGTALYRWWLEEGRSILH